MNAAQCGRFSGTFRIVAYDEGGVRGEAEHLRLVCITKNDDKIAFWGREDARRNIDAVLNAGTPCTVECEWCSPKPDMAKSFGHTHWVSQEARLRIVQDHSSAGT